MAGTKKRSPNFSSAEKALLVELYDFNKSVLTSKLTNDVTNKCKNNIWREIAEQISSIGVCERSAEDVKFKWKNLCVAAKKENAMKKKDLKKKTGGGLITDKIIQINEERESWSGIPGADTLDSFKHKNKKPKTKMARSLTTEEKDEVIEWLKSNRFL
ncbi:PREDICTED: uncharacterized protein LOC106810468 [Priapulus caudatus]|uniref:Regulatory protein zeste n=1 Tax=Priapulus caudatus TaxID=37621 RepID=A0ABM1EAW0_PRICU|nr:PREDICTED: uncharacterized protein LOC106810468 [Priapulus caudatus]